MSGLKPLRIPQVGDVIQITEYGGLNGNIIPGRNYNVERVETVYIASCEDLLMVEIGDHNALYLPDSSCKIKIVKKCVALNH